MLLNGNGLRDIYARWLRGAREAKGWNQKQLHQKSGVSVTTISRIERKEQDAERETIQQLAEAMGIPEPFLGDASAVTVATLSELTAIRGLLEEVLDATIAQSARSPEEAIARAELARTIREQKRKRRIDNIKEAGQ